MRISDWSSDVCSSDLAPPVRAPLRRLIEWTADYYLAPTAAVARMTLASTSALEGGRTITEYRATGTQPGRMTPQREQALERIGDRQGLIRELAIAADVSDGVIRGLVKRSEEHTSELQSIMRNSYAVFCLKKKKNT